MTDPTPGPHPSATDDEPTSPDPLDVPAEPPLPLGAATFTIEGRRAPALFVVGWVATIMGAALFAGGLLVGGGTAASLVVIVVGLVLLAIGLVAGAGSQAIERPARGWTGYTGPSPFLVFLAVLPASLLLQLVLGVPLGILGVELDSPVAALVGLLAIAAVYVGLIRLLVVGTNALSWSAMGVRRPDAGTLRRLLTGAAFGVPLVVLTGLIAAIFVGLGFEAPSSPLPTGGGVGGALLNVVSAAIVAPIAEELFFRGFATTAWLRGRGPRPAGAGGSTLVGLTARQAIVRGALFFAIAHVLTLSADSAVAGLQMAAFGFIVRIPVALALGWIFVRSGALSTAIGLHAAFNGVPVLALLVAAIAGQ